MRELPAFADAHPGQPLALAVVVSARRSAPRPIGTRMAVTADGATAGTVSGGVVDDAVVAAAREVLAGGAPRLLALDVTDEAARAAGLPCGSEIEVWVALARPDGMLALARDERRGAMVTRLDDGRRLLITADGSTTGGLGDAALDDAATAAAHDLLWLGRTETREGPGGEPLLIDVVAPAPRLLIFGAIDLAAPLCTAARLAGWRPLVLDPRPGLAGSGRFPDAESVVVERPAPALARAGGIDRATAIAVLFHDAELDDEILTVALRSDAVYVGAIGSRRTQARRRERLLAAGLTDAELDRLCGPIGLDLGAVTPGETALAIMAEVVAAHHGRDGGRLRDRPVAIA